MAEVEEKEEMTNETAPINVRVFNELLRELNHVRSELRSSEKRLRNSEAENAILIDTLRKLREMLTRDRCVHVIDEILTSIGED